MKLKEKEEARRLRKLGCSIREITDQLGVSKGSVSYWVRDIELTDEQIMNLQMRMHRIRAQGKGALATSAKYRKLRVGYQEEGRKLVRRASKKFVAGLMLFWAEGNKNRNAVRLANTDPELLSFFVDFLRDYFSVKNEDISLRLQWYSGNGISYDDVECYWLKKLKLPKKCMRKSYIDYRPVKNLGRKKGESPYGTAHVCVCSVRIAQQLFGAIQEFIGFDRDEWLDLWAGKTNAGNRSSEWPDLQEDHARALGCSHL